MDAAGNHPIAPERMSHQPQIFAAITFAQILQLPRAYR
jgi:hypothetical protein